MKNYCFDFDFGGYWGRSSVVVTSVIGHLTVTDFDAEYRGWGSCSPSDLFELPIRTRVDSDKKAIADNIKKEAQYAQSLFIWTDCDREGEFIGDEVRSAAVQGNSRIEVKRAKFSNTERAHIIQAARRQHELDMRQVEAVATRIEVDLRLGAAFTRFQTLALCPVAPALDGKVISYGSCQFPALGFVVDRYLRVRSFVPETFWYIRLQYTRGVDVTFHWSRNRLFDRAIVTILFEKCIAAKSATVTNIQQKSTSKWRPLPLTTVELQKAGSRWLRIDSQRVMKIAEELYTQGWISYPRTETDQFDKGINLRSLIEKQNQDQNWGNYAQGLLNGNFQQPRAGSHNDQAHPPIHPVNYVARGALDNYDAARVYEFIVRRFLACCSDDARGFKSTVSIAYGPESFHANGLLVLEKNYLDVYPYEKWESSQQLPEFRLNETFEPTEAKIIDGQTTAPGYLTEPELIALMDANGIGTDATMAEHIAKIKERSYVVTRSRGGTTNNQPPTRGATRGRPRGRGRGRGGQNGGHSHDTETENGPRSNTVEEFVPTTLGTALIQGYETALSQTDRPASTVPSLSSTASTVSTLNHASPDITSLAKPFLRKELEAKLKAICEGRNTKAVVVAETLEQYRRAFSLANQKVAVLKDAVREYVLGENRRL